MAEATFNPDVVGVPQIGKAPAHPMPKCKFKIVFDKDVKASDLAGRPVGKTIEIVEVQFQGSKDWTPWEIKDSLWQTVRQKCGVDIEPLYREWKHSNAAESMEGTALQWVAVLSASQVAGYNAIGIKTLEQLLAVNPDDLFCLGAEGPEGQKAAKRWAKGSDKNTDKQILLKQLEEKDAEIAELKSQLQNVSNKYVQATGKVALN